MNSVLKQNVYINASSAYTCLGDTKSLMQAVYTSACGISSSSVIPEKIVSIGKFKEHDFFKALELVCEEIQEQCKDLNFSKTLLLVGSSVGGMPVSEKHYFQDKSYKNINPQEHSIASIGIYLKKKFGFKDARSYSTACTSSSNALMMGKRLIEVGAYTDILVLGADALCKTTIFGFDSLGILSSLPCRPFDDERDGMNVSEGVAALLLQSKKTENSIAFIGAAGSSDAYHITHPDPSSASAIKAMSMALEDAGIKPSDINYINAHGTGTQANDAGEENAMNVLFPHKPFVSSTKGSTGHTLGAAGALEAVISVRTLLEQRLPVNANLTKSSCELNLVTQAQVAKVKHVMSNSFAFGGNNTSLVFGVPS